MKIDMTWYKGWHGVVFMHACTYVCVSGICMYACMYIGMDACMYGYVWSYRITTNTCMLAINIYIYIYTYITHIVHNAYVYVCVVELSLVVCSSIV